LYENDGSTPHWGIYTITEKDRKKKIINIIDGVMKKEDMNRKMCKVKKNVRKSWMIEV